MFLYLTEESDGLLVKSLRVANITSDHLLEWECVALSKFLIVEKATAEGVSLGLSEIVVCADDSCCMCVLS